MKKNENKNNDINENVIKSNDENETLTFEELKKIEKDSNKNMKKKDLWTEIVEWSLCIIVALILAFLIKFYIGTFTTVQQVSMKPTLVENQKLWLNRTIRTFDKNYNRGDIVTFKAPKFKSVYISNESPKAVYQDSKDLMNVFVNGFLEFGKISLIKRVIGVPGDKIQIKDGKVFRNDKLLDEPYIHGQKTEDKNLTDFVVPENYYFMMGDNRGHSSDSREFGCIPKEMLEGRVVFSVWPVNRLGAVK